MSTTPEPNKVVELDWNEILIVSRQGGQVACWTSWRRNIAAFHDPAMWESVDRWPTYFKRQPDSAGWGFAGYGLIVMDLDTRQAWSINDYSTPSSLYLPGESDVHSDDRIDNQALDALLARPDQWPRVKLSLLPAGLVQVLKSAVSGVMPAPSEATLADLIPPGATIEQARAALTTTHGTLKWQGHEWLPTKGTYLPEDWTQHDDIGQAVGPLIVQMLAQLQATGFPPPDADNVLEKLSECDDDEDEEDEGMASPVEQARQILERWAAPSARQGLRPG